MKNNQSLHITIKQPPNPEPIRTIAVLDDIDNPNISQLINMFLSGVVFEPKDNEFTQNVKDEVLNLLAHHKVIGAAKQGQLISIIFEPK